MGNSGDSGLGGVVRLSAGALGLVWVRLRAAVIAAGGPSVGGMWGAAQLPCEPVAAGSAFRRAKATASSEAHGHVRWRRSFA